MQALARQQQRQGAPDHAVTTNTHIQFLSHVRIVGGRHNGA